MNENRIVLLLGSVSSLTIWELLTRLHVIEGKTQTVLVILSLIPFVYSSFCLLNEFKFENSYFKFIFPLFFGYGLVTVLRGWSFEYDDIKNFIQSPVIFWPFIIPVFVFFDKKITTLGLFLKWSYFLSMFLLCLSIMYPKILFVRLTAETFISLFAPCGFLLLNATYLSNRKVNFTFLIIFISIISLTYLARRSALVTLLGFVTAAYFLNILNRSRSRLFKYFPVIIIIGLFIMFSRYFDSSREILLDKMESRLKEDTRSGLFTVFLYDLKDNMTFGKGMNGSYYLPMRESEIDGEVFGAVEYRYIIENGYLQLLLTGGIIHIILYVLVALPAAFLGIFMSSNQFTRACGTIILLRLTDMFLYGLPSFNMHYVIIWICIGVCYKVSLRRLSNEDFRSEFKKIALS